ncbi:hypothetical protein [Caulobacter sp. NIBR1757]|uniref:hypothetical protein n=1 Tax=Caulobacter sp. NIBR1757 TaxID=3016000 RepID=UPI0022F13C1E|nr:hypothetical protein [Caulobacter sp. NIBR1757]WGM40982.1 hypothetical protein AMEJIAPC_03929 [Caulobacter sp. NIBR1757]
MPRAMRTTALLLAGALALSPALAMAAEPYRAAPSVGVTGDAYAYQRSEAGGSAYSYRAETTGQAGAAVQGQVNCQGYCLPPGYVIEDPYAPRAQPPVHYEERVGEPVYQDEEDRYGASRTYEESSGYSWGYEERGGWERHDEGDWGREPCRQRFDAQGRMIESCGEIRLSDSFFWGGGGVGPEYIDGGGGGGGGGAYAEAGAGASAYASARASVGVSIRIGGRGGHKGGHGGKGGCGCKH